MKPDHLRPGPLPRRVWLDRHALGLACLALGIIAFVVVTVSQDVIWATPDPRVSVPAFLVTLAAAIASLARRERAVPLWLGGLGCAAAALVLGWVLMLAAVVVVTVVLILILHAVM